ncbi:MAG: phosphoribosylanthranilate isomerase [Myxococcota bacterium]|nr:phosphoribosylanthranilate isomerase [Myxococcota bacterium]
MWVKICGVRSIEAAQQAEAAGADAIGLNFHPPSPRAVTVENARAIQAAISIPAYLVVVDHPLSELRELLRLTKAHGVQFHGDTSREEAESLGWPYLRAFRAHPKILAELESWGMDPVLLDAFHPDLHGGTGKRVDVHLAQKACRLRPIILAGGLTPENLTETLQEIPAWGVDVASGVEGPDGKQDLDRIRAFCDAAKRATTLDSK